MLTKQQRFGLTAAIVIVLAVIITVGITYLYPKTDSGNLETIVAGSASDMKIGTSVWDQDNGRVITEITLGKSTANSISTAKKVSDVAKYAASLTSILDWGKNVSVIKKGLTTNITATEFLTDYFDIEKIAALDPTTVAPKVLSWMTAALAKQVDSNCLQQVVNYGLKNAPNKDKSVTIYLSRNFFSEKYEPWVKSNSGHYTYYQNEWGVRSVPSLTGTISFYDLHTVCKETKVCMKYLYDDGRDTCCSCLW